MQGERRVLVQGIPGDVTSCKTTVFELCLRAVSFPKRTQLLLLEAMQ